MTAKDLSNRITSFLLKLPFAIRQVQFNLFDSHDVPRLHNNPAITKDAYKGAVIMLFTLPGCTNMYYGDEAEIDGRITSNEGCRYPMPWDKNIEETSSWNLYSTLAKIKTSSPAFKDGGFKVLWDKDYVFAFARFTQDELWLSVCSSDSENRTIELPIDIFGNNFSCVPECDVFAEKLNAKYKDGKMILEVPAGKSFFIKVE
jgi:alpha-glucosidase